VVDFLNIFLAIGEDYKNNKPLNYLLANGKNIKEYNFKNHGKQTLNFADDFDEDGTSVNVIKLTANDLEVYISKEYDYLPVLIKKKKFKYEIKSYEIQ